MDITPTTTAAATNTLNTRSTKSPERDTETPARIQPTKPSSFSNGVLKRHQPHHHHHHHHHLAGPPVVITYKECLKNHAATLGSHAVDGCGEFMPSPTAIPTDPTSLKCAACGCHRNFHRREPEDFPPLPTNTTTTTIEYQPLHRHHPPPPPQAAATPPPQPHRSPNSSSPPPISSSFCPSVPHMLLALSGGVSAGLNDTNASIPVGSSPARKRFRTKFSQSQKERMYQFAQTVGWKMQKRDEESVQEFCNEVGVDKGVFKVWMHNNKNTLGKKDLNGTIVIRSSNNNLEDTHNNNENSNNNNDDDNNNDNHNNNNSENLDHHHHNNNNNNFESDSVAHVGTNGSSSSS